MTGGKNGEGRGKKKKRNLNCQYGFTEGFPVSARRNVSTTDLVMSR